ncbi:MAG: LysM peptidoglycan-binding domain-containing protein [Verrucomicrobiales bacterium]
MFHRSSRPVRLRRPVSGSVLYQLNAKLNRLPAHLTSEDDWKHDQPGVRLSRVFGVVLGIHIIAIGGLMAYEMFRHREDPNANTAGLRPASREVRPTSVAHGDRMDTFADEPAHHDLRKHVVAPGERLGDIAAQYGVDEKNLMVINKLGEGRAFQSGLKLVIPNRQTEGVVSTSPDRLLAASQVPTIEATTPDSRAAASPHETSDGLVAVDPPPFDPSLPTKRAELVAEAPAVKPKPSAPAAKPAIRPEVNAAAKPASNAAISAKKPAATPAKRADSSAGKKPETAAGKPKPKPKATGRVHVVKDGETAYRIAKAYGVNLDHLIKTNGIQPNTLRPGTTLSIPTTR